MSEKLTYEELENRIKELEKTESKLKSSEAELRESQQIIEGILNAIPARVFWKDQNLVFLGCNKLFAQDAGFSDPKDIIGKDDYQMVWRDHAELYRNDDFEVIESGEAKYLIEEPQTTPEGNSITLLTSKTPLRSAAGETNGVLGAYMDITDRKQTEKALKLNVQRYKSAQRIGRVGNWEYDLLTGKFWCSDEAKRIYGFDPESKDFTADEVENCIPDRERVHQALLDLIDKEKPYDLEFEILPITGPDKKIIKSIAEVVKNESGLPMKVIGVIQDITDRKRADAALQESDERYRGLFDRSLEMVYLFDFEGNFIDANDAALEALGYTKKDIKSLNFMSLLDMDQLPRAIEEVEGILKNGSQENVKEFQLKLKNGELIYIESKGALIYRDGNPIAIQGIARNITQRKKDEEEREKLINELQQALKEVKKLSGLLPICSHCKKIRDGKGYWNQIEAYIHEHSEAEFSHSICQECAKKYYPDMDIYDDNKTQQ